MKNLIRGHIYQLKKDNFFFGCLALSCILLAMSIRFSLSLASVSNPVMGIDGLFDTFLGGDTGEVLERIRGSLRFMPDGQKWLLV